MTSYNATVLTDRLTDDVSDGLIDLLMERLAPQHVALGFTRGHMEAIITLPADSLDQAFSIALGVLNRALRGTGTDVTGIELVTTAEFDRRNGLVPTA